MHSVDYNQRPFDAFAAIFFSSTLYIFCGEIVIIETALRLNEMREPSKKWINVKYEELCEMVETFSANRYSYMELTVALYQQNESQSDKDNNENGSLTSVVSTQTFFQR